MNKRTAILLLICFALAAVTLTLRYLENEKEKIKSQFVPPPEPEKKKVRRVTTTAPFPQEQSDSGEERSFSQQQRTERPSSLADVPPKTGRGVSEQVQPSRVLSPPERERSVQEMRVPQERGRIPDRGRDVPYGADLVTPLEEDPIEDEAVEAEVEEETDEAGEDLDGADQERDEDSMEEIEPTPSSEDEKKCECGGKAIQATVLRKLFSEIGPRYKEKNGGYTRVLRTGHRRGDNAEMALIQLS